MLLFFVEMKRRNKREGEALYMKMRFENRKQFDGKFDASNSGGDEVFAI